MRCTTCLLPGAVHGADIDGAGHCAFCRQQVSADLAVEERSCQAREANLEATLQACRGQGQFDCLANLSGGKDSCYLVYKLKREYGLNVLAFTMNVNLTEIAWSNIRRTVKALDLPHVVYTPPQEFYRKLFRFLLQNQESRGAVRTVCYVCAPLYEGYSLRLAMEKDIPLVLAGYSPGQPDPERMVYEFSRKLICETDWTPPEVRDSGLFTEPELAQFWNPLRYPTDTQFPRYLAPFHAWPYSQAKTMKAVVELGLVSKRRHANPVHSNCHLNWLLMYSDLRNLGYNPYAPEFSKLIREGKASRWYWRIVAPMVDWMIRNQVFLGRHVKRSLEWLELGPEDLRITPRDPASETVSEPLPTGLTKVAG